MFALSYNPAGFDPSRSPRRPDDKRKRQEDAHRKRLMEAERRRRDELEDEASHIQGGPAPVCTPSPGAPRPGVGPSDTPSHDTKHWPTLPFEALGANSHEKYPAEQTQAECMAMDTEDEDSSAPPHIIAAEIASDDDGDEDLASLWQVLGQGPGIEPNVSFEANEVAFDLDRMEKI